MKPRLIVAAVLLLSAAPLFAHRLDEYLQAIIVSVGQSRMEASMRLVPGAAVAGGVIASIDLNHDGSFSNTEEQAYAETVLSHLSLSVDGNALKPRMESFHFPAPSDMKEGTGEIQIDFSANLTPGGTRRTLVIENHHEPRTSVYLMNSLLPQDGNIQLLAQNRNANQSYYRLDYSQSAVPEGLLNTDWKSAVVTLLESFSGIFGMFRLGMNHIAEGPDHLLFLIALLLPAPLIAIHSRWAGFGGVRYSVRHIVRVVTAFTAGHSLTLALGASGLVFLPGRVVEVLIAVSILVSAVHALRPIFPGREPVIAALFGLIHGMAFATTLHNLGLGSWQRVVSLLGFNLGIETMQLIVVAAILPSLLILSRMPAYPVLRVTGAAFAGLASLGWIGERLFAVHTGIDTIVDGIAHRAIWLAGSLLVLSAFLWLEKRGAEKDSHRESFS